VPDLVGCASDTDESMILNRLRLALRTLRRLAWVLLLIALPVTSFPYFPPAMGGEALVRPLSLYPLAVLILLVVLPKLLSQPVSKTVLTLAPFVLVAVASSLLSLMRGIEPALGISVEARVLRGVITLLIGCAFYLTLVLLHDTVEDLRFSLRWIYAGGALALLWGSIQALNIAFPSPSLFAFLERAQTYISIRPLRADRIAGLTYEPHWFAEQIILLVLPWSLAAVLNNYTVFRRRRRWLTVEWLIVGWSVLLLPFTFSRSGLMNLVILMVMSFLLFRSRLPQEKREVLPESAGMRQRLSPLQRRMVESFLVLLVVILPIYLVGTRNAFFARLWQYWRNPGGSLQGYLSYLGFDARVVYAQAAFNTYLAHPVLGVGLGNYAFYFEEMLPYRPIAEVPEVLLMITPEPGRDRLITAKNLYLRLLAETGVVGAVTFLAFVIANLGCALYLWLSRQKEWEYWGAASLCGLLAFSLSALTFDSFVIPNMWVLFGLITAAACVNLNCSQKRAAKV
jgi:O-antigen ligase